MISSQKQRGIININIKSRPLSMKNGKISVSNSLKQCRQCDRLHNQIAIMRKQIVRLNEELQIEKEKNKEMDILCEQITKTKQKLLLKFGSKGPGHKLEPNRTISTIKLDSDRDHPHIKLAYAMWDYV